MSKIKLSKENLEKIKKAVNKVEKKTSGEIATALIKESFDYAFYELMFAVVCGFIYFMVAMFFYHSIEISIQKMFWEYQTSYLLIFYGLSTFIVIFGFYFLANLPFIDRLIVPKSVMRKKVNERAVRYFMESGVYNTRDRTGVLIFISLLERRVEILTDTGVSEKIPEEKWQSMIKHIIEGIKTGNFVENLTASINDCGKLLEKNFPVKKDDKDELEDEIDIIKE